MDEQQGNFEHDWRAALRDSQMEPPKAVWQELDRALTHAELAVIKKRLMTYKWATVAAIAFALIAAMIAITSKFEFHLGEASGDIVMVPKGYQWPEEQFIDGNFAGYAILRPDLPQASTLASRAQHDRIISSQAVRQTSGPVAGVLGPTAREDSPPLQALAAIEEEETTGRSLHHVDRRQDVTSLQDQSVDPSTWWVQKVPDYRYYRPVSAYENLEPEKKRFWAGLNLGTGYYNPNYKGNAELDFVNQIIASDGEAGKQTDIPELSESMKGGASYMLGFNMGINITRRWSLEGGMQYSLQGARTLSNLILESEKFNRAMAVSSEVIGVNAVTSLTEDALSVLSADDTELSNTFQFVTLPLQAGYLVIDRRMSLRINGGLAANLYLGNTIGGTERVSGVEINPQNSPYRALSIGTITGVEVGYRIFDQFHLSVEPVYQRSLQSLTKSSSNFVTNPSTIGIETGLRYTF